MGAARIVGGVASAVGAPTHPSRGPDQMKARSVAYRDPVGWELDAFCCVVLGVSRLVVGVTGVVCDLGKAGSRDAGWNAEWERTSDRLRETVTVTSSPVRNADAPDKISALWYGDPMNDEECTGEIKIGR